MKNKVFGIIMAIVGLLMLLANAVSYIFDWGFKHPSFTILGIVFTGMGMKIVKEKKQ